MVIQPVMFVLLFVTFSARSVHSCRGGQYVNYLVPGILVQTTIFGAIGTAIGLAEDLQRGLIERFKALPMARMAGAVDALADSRPQTFWCSSSSPAWASLVGFRPAAGFFDYIAALPRDAALRVLPLVGFAFIGLAAPNSETPRR